MTMSVSDEQTQAAPAGEEAPVVTSRNGAVVQVTMNRPKARNSLSMAMMGALEIAIAEANRDDSVQVIVLAAEGPAFCAGHDLKEMTAHRSDEDGGLGFYREAMQQCARLMQAIVRSPKPVIAAVHATATAAGCQLVASCDLAVAAADAKFCTPGVNIGLFCSTPMVALTRNVPRKRAMEMLLMGEMIGAQEASDYGLVNRVVPQPEVAGEAHAMAAVIASKSPATVAIGKEAFYRQIEQPLSEAYDYAAEVMVTNMMHRDAEEGIGAFIEKRPPKWSGS